MSTSMNSTIGVIFDMDDVLIDTADIIRKAHILALSQLGIVYKGELHLPAGAPMEQVVDYVSKLVNTPLDFDSYRKLVNQQQYTALGKPIEQYRSRVHSIRDLIESGIAVGVATSSKGERAYKLLHACGYQFCHVITRDETTQPKPDPDCFLKAADLIGVKPEYCVVVEDAPVGIEAAYAAGMKSIAIRTKEQDLTTMKPPPHTILDDITQITPELVYSLFR